LGILQDGTHNVCFVARANKGFCSPRITVAIKARRGICLKQCKFPIFSCVIIKYLIDTPCNTCPLIAPVLRFVWYTSSLPLFTTLISYPSFTPHYPPFRHLLHFATVLALDRSLAVKSAITFLIFSALIRRTTFSPDLARFVSHFLRFMYQRHFTWSFAKVSATDLLAHRVNNMIDTQGGRMTPI
jgi:hypothetical protein